MSGVVEEGIYYAGSYWTIFSDGEAYEGGTGRKWQGGADALRGEMLLDRVVRAARQLGDLEFRWRVNPHDYYLLLKAPTMIGRSLAVEPGRVLRKNVDVAPDLPPGTIQMVAEVPQ